MTVSSTNSRNDYTASGACTFNYTFEVTAAASLDVYLCGALQTSGYTVSGVGSTTGGTVTFTTTPPTGSGVTLIRDEPYTQNLDLVNHGPFDADSLEDSLDLGAFRDQQLLEQIGRAPKFATFSCVANITIDDVTGQAGKIAAVSADETHLEWLTTTCSSSAATGTFLATGTGATARTITAKLGDFVSLKDFGAVGNGVADDTTAIQNAINATTGRTLYAPAGTYVVTATLTHTTVGTSQGLTIIGDGPRKTIFDNRVASGPMLALDGGATSLFQHYGRLEGLRITTTTTPVNSMGVRLRGAWGMELSRVWVDSLTCDAVRILQTSGDPDSVAHLTVEHCRFESNAGYGINDASSSGIATFALLGVSNSYIRANTLGGIRWSGSAAEIQRNSIAQNGGCNGGIYIRHNAVGPSAAVIRANEFDSNCTHHIRIDSGNVYEISDNLFTFQSLTPPGAFGPTTGIQIGDGTNALNGVRVRGARIRSTPQNPTETTAMFKIAANATWTRIENVIWSQFSGANAYRFQDAGVQTYIDDPRHVQTNAVVTMGGSYQPDLTLGDIFRLSACGPLVIQPPTGNTCGADYVLRFSIFNTCTTTITPVFDCSSSGYKYGAQVGICTSRRVTTSFWFDTASSYWVQVGGWSCDING